jgi:hypothetical protein
MTALVSALLHRLGVVRVLQALWRQDLQKADERITGRTHKLIERACHDVAEAEGKRDREGREALEALRQELTQLAAHCEAIDRRTRAVEQMLLRNRQQTALLTRFRDAVASGEIAAHVECAIAAGTLCDDPAPLLTIDTLFPPAIYDIVLASIPPREAFTVRDRTKSDFRTRRPAAVVPELSEAVCEYVDRDLVPRTIVPALVRRFAPFVASYYDQLFGPIVGPAVARLPLEATAGRLMRRTPGYHLDPHLDPKRVLLTGLLYLARPGDPDTYGTTFYRVDGGLIRDHSSTYYPGQAGHVCELARVVPFRANSAAVFLNSAAHGADIPASAPRQTERFAYQVYIGPPVDALKAIIRTLPPDERQPWNGLVVE